MNQTSSYYSKLSFKFFIYMNYNNIDTIELYKLEVIMVKEMNVIVKGIILYEEKVLILKRSNTDEVGAGNWEFVGGSIDYGEALEEALLREIKEEVSIEVEIGKILYATTYNTSPNRYDVIIVYKCNGRNNNVKLSKEHSEYRWVNEKELRQLVYKDIVDALDKYNVFSEIF